MLKVHFGIASMGQFQYVPTTHVFSVNKLFKHILNHFHYFNEMSM